MRKLTVLILALLYVVSLAAVSVFAANATRVGNNQAHMVPIESRQQPLIDGGTEASASAIGSKPSPIPTAMGYFMSPGIQLGLTAYDLFHNMRMARQVEQGADGRVHFVWTFAAFPFDAGTRRVYYTTYTDAVGLDNETYSVSDAEPTQTPERFCTVDVFNNRALVVAHYGAGFASAALDIASNGRTFTKVNPPADVINCENIGCGTVFQPYIWPVACADQDGTGKLVVHIAASEGATAGGSWSAIAYFRGLSSGVIMEDGMYGTCGMFVDSCQATGYAIAADPNSDRVVIVYPKGRQANRDNNDLAYRLSTDMGATWGGIVDLTHYATDAMERVAGDMSVLFTSDGYFHILYVATPYDSVAGLVSDQESKLWHWSSGEPTKRSLVLDANTSDDACNTAAFEYNISKVTLTQCINTEMDPDDTLLYAVYSRQLGTTADPDCSDLQYFNQEVFLSPSSTMGETWGAPVNLTNTKTNGCLDGACADDGSSSSARYVKDSLRIEYMEDLAAGSNVGNESSASTQNPVRFISYSCIDMADYRIMTCTPSAVKYPNIHAVKNASKTQDLVLTNGGNQPIDWTAALLGGTPNAPVSVVLSGNVPAGYTNSATITATVGPLSTEGLFHNTIRFTYDGGAKSFDVPIDFYVFDSWFLPQNVPLRTSTNRMAVNQTSQAAVDVSASSFSYFANTTEDFITDGSMIMGNAVGNLSWKIFEGGQGDPTPSNNYGRLYALSVTTIDSTTFPSYRIATAIGTNRDSTVGFDVAWYAPKHIDSADFYIGHFELYQGTNTTASASGLTIAYAVDWDVPADSSTSDNTVVLDASRQMIALQGTGTGLPGTTPITRTQGFGATAVYREDKVAIIGGFAWGNNEQVYGQGGYRVDSTWKYLELTTGYGSLWNDSVEDLSTVMIVAKDYDVTPTSRLVFDVVLAAKRAQDNPAELAGLNLAVDKAKKFICDHIAVGSPFCSGCEECGDANGDGGIDISDAVFLISYIFSGGGAPGDCNYPNGKGDANGDGGVDISDAVFLIAYIFSGGGTPHCL
ncbi:MAG: hypothetical protein E4G91_05475 [Candidatus Zixiibacteriota bacterium]|nr:MAG: hypothetical protein E4G91_05475 [candidate division Zixibacteria bacterium]